MQGNKIQKSNAKELRAINSQSHHTKGALSAINQQIENQFEDFEGVGEFVG
jgi:hypothetical protein